MRMKELCNDERPREKLLEKGPEALSNAELIAIMLRTGTGKMNAIDLGRELLRSGGGTLNSVAAIGSTIESADAVPAGSTRKASAYRKYGTTDVTIPNPTDHNKTARGAFAACVTIFAGWQKRSAAIAINKKV